MSTQIIPLTIEGLPPDGRRRRRLQHSPSPPPVSVSENVQPHNNFLHINNGGSRNSQDQLSRQHDHQKPPSNVQQHLQEFSRRLPPLSIDVDFDDDDNDDDDNETERFLESGSRRNGDSAVRTHFRLPSVRLPSRSKINKSRRFERCWWWICNARGMVMYCCVLSIVLISLIGYFGGNEKYYEDSFVDHDDDDVVGQGVGKGSTGMKNKYVSWKDKDSSSSTTPSSDLETFYDYNFRPVIGNDYSNVSSLDDLFELSRHISLHCLYNQSSCPCQPLSLSSATSSSSSFDDLDDSGEEITDSRGSHSRNNNNNNSSNGVGFSSNNMNSRLVPRPGFLEGWETAFTWNVQTASSKRGTNSNIVFLGDSITELWRGTQLGKRLNDRNPTTTTTTSGGGSEITHTFDGLFRTTLRVDQGPEETDSDRIEDDDDDEYNLDDDDDDNNVSKDEIDNLDTNQNDVNEESPSKEISLQGIPFGVAGDQTTNLLWRMQNGELSPNLDPAIFVVLIGTNDLSYDQCSAENVVVGILHCVEYLLEERPNAQILLHGLLPRTLDKNGHLTPSKDDLTNRDRYAKSPRPYFWSHIKAINTELKRYADRRQSVKYLDSSDLFLKRRNQIDLDLMPDGTHPSPEGYQLLGTNLQKKILDMI